MDESTRRRWAGCRDRRRPRFDTSPLLVLLSLARCQYMRVTRAPSDDAKVSIHAGHPGAPGWEDVRQLRHEGLVGRLATAEPVEAQGEGVEVELCPHEPVRPAGVDRDSDARECWPGPRRRAGGRR